MMDANNENTIKNKVHTGLYVWTENPSRFEYLLELSKNISIKPKQIWKIGDHILPNDRSGVHNDYGANFEIKRQNMYNAAELLSEFIDMCADCLAVLKNFEGVEMKLYIAVYTYEIMPNIYLDRKLMRRIADYGLDLDQDIFCFNDDEAQNTYKEQKI
jgi:hypothetical protein